MRTYLNVPFEQKDEARRAGARWDPAHRRWYVENVERIGDFARWMDARLLRPHRPAAGASEPPPRRLTDREKRVAEAAERRRRAAPTRAAARRNAARRAKRNHKH